MQVLSDAQWVRFEAAIAAAKLRGARPRKEERCAIEAIIWRLDNGAKWRSIPKHHEGDDVAGVLRPVQRASTPFVELLAASATAEPAVNLSGALAPF
jgi:transposase